MDEQTFEVYNVLAKHDLQLFFTSFNQILKVYRKRDFVLLCREDLLKVGLTSRYSIQLFENLLHSLKNDKKITSPTVSFNYVEFYINTVLPNQEPVIIGSNDIKQEEALGVGHFGKVYKGSWQRKDLYGKSVKVPVAIKTLTDGKEMSWKKEVSIFTALNQNHSNIIKFFGLLIGEEDKIKMVTEFAQYGSLFDRLRAKDITSVTTLSQFAVQIATGMVYLHSKNLVHRDLSARNILVTGKNQVKISDFGLSKVLGETQTEWVMESAESLPMRWLAPESLNNGIFTSSSDVWSFAVVLWEMFTFGEVPWGDFNNEQVKSKIQNCTFLPEPKFCPCAMYEVMKMCWNRDQQARPPFHIIREELLSRQPDTVIAVKESNGNYDLNFVPGDYITCIKVLNNTIWWLGQHENNFSFGRFVLEHTKPIRFILPFSIQDEEDVVEANYQPSANSIKTSALNKDIGISGNMAIQCENEENTLYEPFYQVPKEVSYVNMNPLQRESPYQTISLERTKSDSPSQQNPVKPSKIIAEIKLEKTRPHSEVLSSRKDFFDMNTDFNGQLKSGSDSRLGFKDTKPEIQETVNDRIAKNMSAFLSLTDPVSDSTVPNGASQQSRYLSPVDVSTVKPRSNLDFILTSVDPLANPKSASCENIYEEIKDFTVRDGRNTQTLRPRPKSKPTQPEEVSGPSAYRKSSFDAYAQSVRKDFDLLAQQIGPPKTVVQSCENLPKSVQASSIPTTEIQNHPNIQNARYLQNFNSVVPVGQVSTQQQPIRSQYNLNPVTCHSRTSPNRQLTNASPGTQPAVSPSYSNFVVDPKLNHFKYDPKAAPKSANTATTTAKEKSRQAATNYTENDWDLFEECVKDPKKIDKNRKKPSGKRISWPKNEESGKQTNEKDEFSDKFKKIRNILPDASVGECLEGLRSSDNAVEGAVRYIKILKLYRHNYGYSFEDCHRILEECGGEFSTAEKLLKASFVKKNFNSLDIDQVKETLGLCSWNTTLALKTVFVQQCRDFGISESKATSIFNENQENVTKALEMAKIVRVAEITNKPEHFCFKTLTNCKWDIQRAVNKIFSKS